MQNTLEITEIDLQSITKNLNLKLFKFLFLILLFSFLISDSQLICFLSQTYSTLRCSSSFFIVIRNCSSIQTELFFNLSMNLFYQIFFLLFPFCIYIIDKIFTESLFSFLHPFFFSLLLALLVLQNLVLQTSITSKSYCPKNRSFLQYSHILQYLSYLTRALITVFYHFISSSCEFI